MKMFALALFITSVAASEDWSWAGDNGPAHWSSLGYSDCDGQAQSPIEISAKAAGYSSMMSKLHPLSKYVTSENTHYTVTQSHGGPKFTCRDTYGCGDITWKGVTYYLHHVHFHAPAEHTVNKNTYGMVAQMVHQSKSGKYSVIAVNFEGSARLNTTGLSDSSKFLKDVFTYREEEVQKTVRLNFGTFIQEGSGFYKYDGSFTSPPCTEGVKWFVQATPVSITPKQINRIWKQFGGYPGVARPPQPLHGRAIEYFVDAM